MTQSTARLLAAAALATGIVLLAATLSFLDLGALARSARALGPSLPLILLPGAAWHLLRTAAWALCFPVSQRVSFGRLARVRLAAEAFSFVTIRGLAGEPLKVLLLADDVAPAAAASAVAIERVAYIVITLLVVAVTAALAQSVLPLTEGWRRTFRAIAVGAATLIALGAIAVARTRRIRYEQSPPAPARTAFRRAVSALASATGELLYRNPRRLAGVAVLELACYVCMVLEVWLVLRVGGTATTLTGAFAVETFTRVTSMASAFIPMNLGALEASNAAAAVAIHTGTAGAAALVVARRVRGLFFAAAGFGIYPLRLRHRFPPSRQDRGMDGPSSSRQALVLIAEAPGSGILATDIVAGLPMADRTVRAARRAGYDRVLIWARTAERARAIGRAIERARGHAVIVHDAPAWAVEIDRCRGAAVTVVGPETIVSPRLLEIAAAIAPPDIGFADVSLDADLEPSPASAAVLHRCRPQEVREASLLDAYAPAPEGRAAECQTDAPAFCVRSRTDAERAVRRAATKTTDGITGRFNRRFSLPISIALIRWTRVGPNTMSILVLALGLSAGWLFARGSYWSGVSAAALSLAASILDGCDGELARLKCEDSTFGCWLETAGDYVYYFAVLGGITIGAVRSGESTMFAWAGVSALTGTAITFALLIFLRSRITKGQPEQLHETARTHVAAQGTWWAWFLDRCSVLATRSAMPYGILAAALADALPMLLMLMAIGAHVYWIGLATHLGGLLSIGSSPVSKPQDSRSTA